MNAHSTGRVSQGVRWQVIQSENKIRGQTCFLKRVTVLRPEGKVVTPLLEQRDHCRRGVKQGAEVRISQG